MSKNRNKVFAFCNQKGGVGKTTTTINMAASLSELGFKVLVMDFDAQGNATSGLGIDKNDCDATTYDLIIQQKELSEVIVETEFKNIFVAPTNASLSGAEVELVNEYGREFILRNKLEKNINDFDFVFIDCPPSLGLLTINSLVAADALLVPLQCEYYALEGLGQLLDIFNLVRDRLNPNLKIGGVLLTLADFRANLTAQVVEEVRSFFGDKAFETIIPRSVKVSEAPSYGKPAIFYDRYNKGSLAYIIAAKEFAKRFSKKKIALEEEVVAN